MNFTLCTLLESLYLKLCELLFLCSGPPIRSPQLNKQAKKNSFVLHIFATTKDNTFLSHGTTVGFLRPYKHDEDEFRLVPFITYLKKALHLPYSFMKHEIPVIQRAMITFNTILAIKAWHCTSVRLYQKVDQLCQERYIVFWALTSCIRNFIYLKSISRSWSWKQWDISPCMGNQFQDLLSDTITFWILVLCISALCTRQSILKRLL